MAEDLRTALEKQLGSLPVMTHENGYPVQALPKADLLALLQMHPAEPAGLVVTDHAVEAAKDAALEKWQHGSADTTQMLLSVRAGLEAAVPFLQGSAKQHQDQDLVAISPAAVAAELREHGTLHWNNGWPTCTCGHEYGARSQGGVSWDEQTAHRADAVAKLARPVAEVKAEALESAAQALTPNPYGGGPATAATETYRSAVRAVLEQLRQRADRIRSGGVS